jgi:hypothetical protein
VKVKAANTAAFSTTGDGQPGTIGDLEPAALLAAGSDITPTGEVAQNAHGVSYAKVRAPGQTQTLWVRTSSIEEPKAITAMVLAAKAGPAPELPWWQIALGALGVIVAGYGVYSLLREKR